MQTFNSMLIAVALTFSVSVQAQVLLKLSGESAQNLGVRTELLKGSTDTPTRTLDAHVLDPSTLYAQVDELQLSSSALALSSAQAARIGRLYRNQQNATQSAFAQATLITLGDQKNLALAQIAFRTTWGDAAAAWSAQERAGRISDLHAGRASLLRVELDTAITPETQFSTGDTALELIGLLPSADMQTGRTGALLWLSRGLPALSRLQVNSHATAAVADASTMVVIPRSAILRLNGGSFVFIQTAEDSYAMREVIAPELSANGWLIHKGFAAGERIVTAGAASLLTMARGAGAEEDE